MKTRRISGALLALAAVGLCALPARAQSGGEAVQSTRATVQRWVETQQLIADEARNWQLGKEMLEQRTRLIEGEIAALREKIRDTREAIGEANGARRDLSTNDTKLDLAAAELRTMIGAMEFKTAGLVSVLPDPLRERIKPLSRRLPKPGAETVQTLGERFQNVVGVLNELNKFNGEVLVTSEVRELPGGVTAEVASIYLGLGQAYYVSTDGSAAGVGRPGAEGFVWTPADAMAPEIARAIAIYKNEQVPAYVPLEVAIQ